jgi:hypothetical protein
MLPLEPEILTPVSASARVRAVFGSSKGMQMAKFVCQNGVRKVLEDTDGFPHPHLHSEFPMRIPNSEFRRDNRQCPPGIWELSSGLRAPLGRLCRHGRFPGPRHHIEPGPVRADSDHWPAGIGRPVLTSLAQRTLPLTPSRGGVRQAALLRGGSFRVTPLLPSRALALSRAFSLSPSHRLPLLPSRPLSLSPSRPPSLTLDHWDRSRPHPFTA